MIFRQLFDHETFTYTYLIGDPKTRKAAIIDPVREQVERDLQIVRELGLSLEYILDTHVHADHVTGAGLLRERTGAKTVASKKGAECVDVHVAEGDAIQLGELTIGVLETPGHTDDSLSYRIGDKLFTGDALFIRGCGRTDFQNGDADQLYDSVHSKLFAFSDDTWIYPAHDYKGRTVSTVGEERRFNPRLAGKSREEFVELMNNLGLPPPKHIHEAVPANRLCGQPSAQLQ